MDKQELANYIKAGEIAKKAVAYAKEIIKPGMPLLEIAEKIHKKIEDLNAIPAFPVNLAVNDIAAHYHPIKEDESKAEGLLKVDIGVHFNGYIADTAFSLDLTPDNKYKDLIKASEEALENALKKLKQNPETTLNEIGKTIKETIENKKFSPIINLSGHSLSQYNLHAGITIPNYANGNKNKLKEGAYAIEPFATTGEGRIYEGGSSNIYRIENPKTPRSPNARKILEYVFEKYQTLPFSLREVQEKFPGARIALRELEQQGIIKNYPQLIETSHKPVSQAEHTIIIEKGKVIVTTQ
ncbi:MAG: type II methionyl aminopeptidase [Candidatus Nanoarchaeia archaeon]|nr:type II methionyl aminopeptidase [Candidatus Nanoarchaeia archaeon]MDD5740454.1 type II methionyl aminopeptidase [Candidatus Nanoarchaeia archaeon]